MNDTGRKVLSLAAVVFFGVLALGSKMSAEEKAKWEQKKQANRAALDAYVKTMGMVHAAVQKLDPMSMSPKRCDGAAMLQAIGDPASSNLHVVYAPFLARFATPDDKTAWTKDESPWAWITDSGWSGHFEKHPGERDDYALRHTGETMRDYFLKRKYMIVVVPDGADSMLLPQVPKSDDFESGLFLGWAVVFDQADAKIVCQYRLDVENSKVVWTKEGGAFDKSDKESILEDFQDNFEKALERGLGDGPGVLTGYGKFLR